MVALGTVTGLLAGSVLGLVTWWLLPSLDGSMVVVPGRPETNRSWRNLAAAAPVEVLLRGRWQHDDGILLHPGEPGYDTALAAYQRRWPRLDIPQDSLLVLVRLATLSPTAGRTPPSPRDAG